MFILTSNCTLRGLGYVGQERNPMYCHGQSSDLPMVSHDILVCPVCGHAWGEIKCSKYEWVSLVPCKLPEGYIENIKYRAEMRPCEKHGGGNFISLHVWDLWSVETLQEVYDMHVIKHEIRVAQDIPDYDRA